AASVVIESEHVAERGAAGPRQAGNEHRVEDDLIVDFRMAPIPVLHLQTADQWFEQAAGNGYLADFGRRTFAVDGGHQLLEAKAKAVVAKIVEAGYFSGLIHQALNGYMHGRVSRWLSGLMMLRAQAPQPFV